MNEAFARKFGLDGARAVGHRISRTPRADEFDIEIVGVVPDSRYADVKDAPPPVFYSPVAQSTPHTGLTFYARTLGDESAVLAALPGAVREIAPNVPLEALMRFEEQVKENVFLDWFLSILAAAFALLATTLAAVGLYGVLSYAVEQRTREIGIRMALGAGAGRVRGMVLRQMVWMAGVGALLGAVIAIWLGRAAQVLLYEMEGASPLVIAAAALLIGSIALTAAYLPARRASRVDPMVSLRYD